MPTQPPSVCLTPGCPNLGHPRCPSHTRDYNDSSGRSARARIYGRKRWQTTRRRILSRTPICTHPGCTTPATPIDHIIPLAVDPSQPYDEANLQALCVAHHNAKTGTESHRT